jgi:hypothetical protein
MIEDVLTELRFRCSPGGTPVDASTAGQQSWSALPIRAVHTSPYLGMRLMMKAGTGNRQRVVPSHAA